MLEAKRSSARTSLWALAIVYTALALITPSIVCAKDLPRDDGTVAVLYPKTGKPYNSVFTSIVVGVQKRLSAARVRTYTIRDSDAPGALRAWLAQARPAAVITLGRLAYQFYRRSGAEYPYVVGALDASPDTHPKEAGISLSADPALLFATLQRLSPKTRRVLVVYNPKRDQWLIDLAKRLSADYALEVEAFEATQLKQATGHFWNIFKYANPRTDALWLTVDSSLVNANNLPVIVEQSWARRMVVFSNNLEHVDQGVLFALYPDMERLGARLAEWAWNVAQSPERNHTLQPLRDVKKAVNERISDHLGLQVPAPMRREFDLVFPRR